LLYQDLVEEFIAERRLGDLGDVVVEDADDDETIPAGPDGGLGHGGEDGGTAAGAAKAPATTKGRGLPAAQISAGVAALWITAGMLLVVIHEHHDRAHHKRNSMERNFEYVLQMVVFVSPVALVGLFGYLRNRHWDRVADLKNL